MPKTIAISQNRHILCEPSRWQQQLAQAITDPNELLLRLQLEPDAGDFHLEQQAFNLKVPLAYVDKMQPGDPLDPLLLQVMTQSSELVSTPGYSQDPVGDLEACKVSGLLHKYHGRVLLITTAACAIHCRYCFRRHFPYQQQQAGREQWTPAIEYISRDSSISEVILSGGDPLVLSDDRLAQLINQLETIPHLKRLRIHTRLPVVLPDRITDSLISLFAESRFNVSLVLHANHANEISRAETDVLRRLQSAGIILLNQAVLLKGINHQLQQQIDLSEALHSAGVIPYYLHLLDAVQGAAHFNIEHQQAKQLIRRMRELLPGFMIPRLVREIAGKKSKTPANEL